MSREIWSNSWNSWNIGIEFMEHRPFQSWSNQCTPHTTVSGQPRLFYCSFPLFGMSLYLYLYTSMTLDLPVRVWLAMAQKLSQPWGWGYCLRSFISKKLHTHHRQKSYAMQKSPWDPPVVFLRVNFVHLVREWCHPVGDHGLFIAQGACPFICTWVAPFQLPSYWIVHSCFLS